jgi:alpha-tubulin suppressor-like RCC1 family protein
MNLELLYCLEVRSMRRAFGLLLIALCVLMAGCGLPVGTSYTVSGRIVCADDPSQGIGDVYISFSGSRSFGTAKTNDDGTWTKSDLRGSVTIAPANADWVFEPGYRQVNSAEQDVSFAGVPGASNSLGFRQVVAGKHYALFLRADGTVYFWGYRGSVYIYGAAMRVSGLEDIVAVAAGADHSLALRADGTVWAWGANDRGQLGNGMYSDRCDVPAQVAGLSGVRAIAAGECHSLAVRDDGTVWEWGDNSTYQIGHGAPTTTPAPVMKAGMDRVESVAASGYRSLALKTDGTVWQWGFWQLALPWGDSVYWLNRYVGDAESVGLHGVTSIAAGSDHSMALKDDGTVWAWGVNIHGQLGGGTKWDRDPLRVEGLDEVVAVTAGDRNGLAVRADGSVWAWGAGAQNYLGTGTYSAIAPPTMVMGISGVADVASGEQIIVAADCFGDLWHWGMSYPGASPATAYPIGAPRRITGF